MQNRAEQFGNTNAKSHFAVVLARYVGPAKFISVKELSPLVGMSEAAIRMWLNGYSEPGYSNLRDLIAQLPDEFLNQLLMPIGFCGAHRVDGEIEPAEALREVAEMTAVLADALADGRIDHTEVPKLRKEGTEAVVALMQFLKQLV